MNGNKAFRKADFHFPGVMAGWPSSRDLAVKSEVKLWNAHTAHTMPRTAPKKAVVGGLLVLVDGVHKLLDQRHLILFFTCHKPHHTEFFSCVNPNLNIAFLCEICMINKAKIEQTLRNWAPIRGRITINDLGQVSVSGRVMAYPKPTPGGKIPVEFLYVAHTFHASSNNLTSLENCPQTVGKDFIVAYNQLTSLEGMPQDIRGNVDIGRNQISSLMECPPKIKGYFICRNNLLENFVGGPVEVLGEMDATENPLKSLEGFPTKLQKVYLTYSPSLPLLRTLVCKKVILVPTSGGWKDQNPLLMKVEKILNKYAGQGKRVMFDCQKELEDAGFEENARW